MRGIQIAAVAAAVAGVAVGVAPAADATFPGRNGEIVYPWLDVSGKAAYSESGVGAFAPWSGRTREVRQCYFGAGTGEDCNVQDAAVSADGATVAVLLSFWNRATPTKAVDYGLSLRTLAGVEVGSAALGGPAMDPAFSPDGSRLTVTRYEDPDRQDPTTARVVTIDRDGRELGTVGGPGASDADWSRDGRIAFVQAGNVWIARPGETARQLTTAGGSAPSWSPDGRRLAYQRDGAIMSIRSDGRGERRIGKALGTAPAWSPDGRYIAYLAVGGAFWTARYGSIWTMTADGRCARRVKRRAGYLAYGNPSWAKRPGKPARGRVTCGKSKAKPKPVKRKPKPKRPVRR